MSVRGKYYTTGFIVIIILPIVIVALYEWLGGGVLNGLAGSWRESMIDPDILLLFINPAILLIGYGVLLKLFKRYLGESAGASVLGRIFAWSVFTLATVVVVTGVFWKFLTT